jgi:F0F1-type ATP synthase membrane subunit b/b'
MSDPIQQALRAVRDVLDDARDPSDPTQAADKALSALALIEQRLEELEREVQDYRERAWDGTTIQLEARAERAEAETKASMDAAASTIAERDARIAALEEGIASAMTSLATGPAKDGYAYSVLAALAI